MTDIALELNKVTKVYNNKLVAVDNIDLKVSRGDFFALLGPNGAGKTTTISMISTLVNRSSGKISILGHDLDSDSVAAKSLLGVVPQEVNLLSFDKVSNVLLNQAAFYGVPRKEAKSRAFKLLSELSLWDKRDAKVMQLSGGMKRRVMIARALMHNPQVLLLDEPTAGVDIEIRQAMWEHLVKLNQKNGLTIILTTHYLEEAERLCNNIAIMDHGSIVKNTSISKLLASLAKEHLVLYLRDEIQSVPDALSERVKFLDAKTLEVELRSGQMVSDIFCELAEHGIVVERLRNKSNRLEQLFLDLVSNSQREKNA